MSRIGKKPVTIPAGVKIDVKNGAVRAEGPKGKLDIKVHPRITVAKDGDTLVCDRQGDDKESKSLHGLFRSLIQNLVVGVSQGFEKRLEIVGVGFGATVAGKDLSLTVGYSKPVKVPIPTGVSVTLPDATHIVVAGPDKQQVGQFAAEVRAVRKPEPYKGTGIRYQGEQVRRKAGKAFGSGG